MKNLTPFILIILAIGTFFFLIDPKYKDIQQLNAQISENKQTLELARRLRAQRDDLRNKFNQISQRERQDLEKLLPDNVDNVRLIIDIETIADTVGILIKDIDIKTPEQDSNQPRTAVAQESVFDTSSSAMRYVDSNKIGIITFSFTITTRYEDFLVFLEQLEESKRIVDIRSIELSRGTGDTSFFDYKVTFDTYWLK